MTPAEQRDHAYLVTSWSAIDEEQLCLEAVAQTQDVHYLFGCVSLFAFTLLVFLGFYFFHLVIFLFITIYLNCNFY